MWRGVEDSSTKRNLARVRLNDFSITVLRFWNEEVIISHPKSYKRFREAFNSITARGQRIKN
jgi:hypothetical protein